MFDSEVKHFRYGIEGDAFVIAAPDDVKAGWGVFYMLEQLADCLFCTSEYEHVPSNPDLTLETESYVHKTAFEHNYVHYKDYMDHPVFAMKRGTFEMGYNDEERNPLFGCGFAHSIFRFLSTDLYDEHPEYFCMRNGERSKPEYIMALGGIKCIGNLQPCLSNPDVLEIVCENLKKKMDENPKALIWNVSQSDNFFYPECVSALYPDAPVMNLLSCPAGVGKAGDSMLAEFVDATGVSLSELISYREHPIDKMHLLLENNIPIILVYGDSDDIVPYCENGALLERYYRERDGVIVAIGKENCGHHPHGLEDNTPIIQFAEKYCK